MMAAGLGIEIDEIAEHWEAEPAPESYDIAAGRIEKGTIAALKFSISGMVGGRAAIVVQHVTRTRDDLRPDWARPAAGGGCYRVEITGEPSYVVEVRGPSEAVQKFLSEQSEVTAVEARKHSGELTEFEVRARNREDPREALATKLAAKGWPVRRLDLKRVNLDALFNEVVRSRQATAMRAQDVLDATSEPNKTPAA